MIAKAQIMCNTKITHAHKLASKSFFKWKFPRNITRSTIEFAVYLWFASRHSFYVGHTNILFRFFHLFFHLIFVSLLLVVVSPPTAIQFICIRLVYCSETFLMPFSVSRAYHSIHLVKLDPILRARERTKDRERKRVKKGHQWKTDVAAVRFENDEIVCIEWLWSRIKISISTFLPRIRRHFFPFSALKFGLIISTIVSCYADGTNCICGFVFLSLALFLIQWLYRNCEHE